MNIISVETCMYLPVFFKGGGGEKPSAGYQMNTPMTFFQVSLYNNHNLLLLYV